MKSITLVFSKTVKLSPPTLSSSDCPPSTIWPDLWIIRNWPHGASEWFTVKTANCQFSLNKSSVFRKRSDFMVDVVWETWELYLKTEFLTVFWVLSCNLLWSVGIQMCCSFCQSVGCLVQFWAISDQPIHNWLQLQCYYFFILFFSSL